MALLRTEWWLRRGREALKLGLLPIMLLRVCKTSIDLRVDCLQVIRIRGGFNSHSDRQLIFQQYLHVLLIHNLIIFYQST